MKALELDPLNAGAHNVWAKVIQGYEWDLEPAGKEYRRAFQLKFDHLLTRLWYAEHLTRVGLPASYPETLLLIYSDRIRFLSTFVANLPELLDVLAASYG